MIAGYHQIIHDLVQVLCEGQEGFVNAAVGINDPDLKNRILEFAVERRKLADELSTHGSTNFEWPNPLLKPNSRWLDLKKAMTLGSERAILIECEREEYQVFFKFKEAMGKQLPPEVLTTLQRIAVRVKAVHDQIRALREECASSLH